MKNNNPVQGLFSTIENLALIRGFSLLMAAVFSLLILIYPHIVTSQEKNVQHGLLTLQMIGICSAFFHGMGFSAHRWYFRLLISPIFHWPIMLSVILIN
jgi:predicted membrane protein